MKKVTPSLILSLLVVAATMSACSGGGKGGAAASGPVDETIRIEVPEDRKLVKDLEKVGGTLFNVSTDAVGTDAKGLSLTDVGNPLTAQLSKISVNESNLDDVNVSIDSYLTQLMNQDVETAKQKMLAEMKKATQSRSAEEIRIANSRSLEELALAKARQTKLEAASNARRSRDEQVVKSYGGPNAVKVLEIMKLGSVSAIEEQTRIANELATKINALDDEQRALVTARRSRDSEIAQLHTNVGVIKANMLALESGVKSMVATQKATTSAALKGIDAQISGLEKEIGYLDASFLREFNRVYPAAEAKAIEDEYTSFVPWGKNKEEIKKETQARVRKDVIAGNPNLFTTQAAADELRADLAKLRAEKAVKDAELKKLNSGKTVDLAVFSAPASNDMAQLKKSLADTEWVINHYTEVEDNTFSDDVYTNRYIYNGKWMSQAEWDSNMERIIKARSLAMEELREIDPTPNVKVLKDGKPIDPKTDKLVRAERSVEYFKTNILKALNAKLAKFEAFKADSKKVEESYQQELLRISAEFDSAKKAKGEKFKAELDKVAGAFDSEKAKAEAEFAKLQSFFGEMRGRLAGVMKTVAACHNAGMSESSSPRTTVSGVTADEGRDTLLALSTFDDFVKVESKSSEDDKDADVTFQQTKDFKRFVTLLMNDEGKVVAFRTESQGKPFAVTKIGRGMTNVEYKDPNDGEKPTFNRGEISYKVNQIQGTLGLPLSHVAAGNYTVISCAETTKGVESKSRKLVITEGKRKVAPATPGAGGGPSPQSAQ